MAWSNEAPARVTDPLPGFRPRPRPVAAADATAGWRVPAPRTPRTPGGPPVSARDRELLRHLAEGRSTAQIAAALSVSGNTARTRIRRVSAKLAVPDRDALVPTARVLGLV